MAKRLAGQTVVEGGRLKWGVVAGILIGSPLYAFFEEIIRTIQLIGDGIESGILGIQVFLWTVISTPFRVLSSSMVTAWRAFLQSIQFSGPLTFALAVFGVGTFAILIVKSLEVGLGR